MLGSVLAVVATFAAILVVVPSAGGVAGFGDVGQDHFYTDGVQWMVDNEITAGLTETCFGPADVVTRGQGAALIWRMETEPSPASPHAFDDVVQAWQHTPVAWMVEKGITFGTTATTFEPERALNRGEFAALMWRLAGRPTGAPPHGFLDVSEPWQQDAVSWMVDRSITFGVTATLYAPHLPVTRGEAAAFLYRYKGEPSVTVDRDHPTVPTCPDQVPGPPPPPPPPTPPPSESVMFTASADMGAGSDTTATLETMADLDPVAHFVAGDISYSEVTPESAWCSYVKGVVGSSLPFELIVGNHEDDTHEDGFIRNFTSCLPDRLGVVGDYGVQYHVDLAGLVRVVAIAPDLNIDGVAYDYEVGSSERFWLEIVVADARERGLWVVLMQHKPCLSSAEKSCAVSEELTDWAAANVDVVFMGHAHNYQRSHQLSCVEVDTVDESCIVDEDGNHRQGRGAVFVTNGLGGRERPVDRTDSEFGYFAALMGEGDPDWGHGFSRFDVTDASLTATFVGGDTTWTDSFTIRR